MRIDPPDEDFLGGNGGGPGGSGTASPSIAPARLKSGTVSNSQLAGNLIGAISSDDVIEALVPEDWRARVEASTGV